jgi:hypothetical protein
MLPRIKSFFFALILTSFAFTFSVHASDLSTAVPIDPNDFTEVEVPGQPVVAPSALGPIGFAHLNGKYYVLRNGEQIPVQRCDVAKSIRNVTSHQLETFLAKGGYLYITQANDGSYRIADRCRVRGGGGFGAIFGALVTKAFISTIGHGAILLVSGAVGIICPPAGIATGMALESILAVPIESASMVGAMAGGILGGVVTGPV